MCVGGITPVVDLPGTSLTRIIIAVSASGGLFAFFIVYCTYRANRKVPMTSAQAAAMAASAAWRAGKAERQISAANTAAAYGAPMQIEGSSASGGASGGAPGGPTGAGAYDSKFEGASLLAQPIAAGTEGAIDINVAAAPVVTAPRFSLVFDTITCEIQTKATSVATPPPGNSKPSGPRMVLKGISGVVRPGEMVAIIGPSGAGKSTLLDILADRRRAGVHGFIGLDNDSYRAPHRKDVIHYVLQEDKMMETQTVREAITFSATLRLPRGTSAETIAIAVQRVLDDLSLSHIADSPIGSSDAGGISGGERKRVAIGMELVTAPGMLLLDEPTTGLDSANAELVVKVRCPAVVLFFTPFVADLMRVCLFCWRDS